MNYFNIHYLTFFFTSILQWEDKKKRSLRITVKNLIQMKTWENGEGTLERRWSSSLFFKNWWSLECHTGWSKSDREREILYDIPYVWNLKINDTNELTKQRLTDLEYEPMALGGRDSYGAGEGHVHSAALTTDSQQGPAVRRGSSARATWQPGWEGVWGEGIHGYAWLGPSAVHLKLPENC